MKMSKEMDNIIPRSSNRQLGISPGPVKSIRKRSKAVVQASNNVEEIGSEREEDRQVNEEEEDEQVNGEEEDEQINGEEEEQQADPEENVQSTAGEAQNTKKRRTRGPTKMRGVAKHHEDKIEVEWNSLGAHVGPGSVLLSSFMGILVREHVPVLLDDWRYLDPKIKDMMWEQIQARFNVTEAWQKEVLLGDMNNSWRSSKSRLVSKIRKLNKKEVLDMKPSNIQSVADWKKWVKAKTSAEFQVVSEKFRELKKGQIPHTASRKGLNRLADDMKKKSSDPSEVSRSKVWVAGHTHSDGRPVRPEFADTIEKIKSLDSEMASTASTSIRDDAVSQVLGRDKPGRVRGMGKGITATKLGFLQARDAHVHKLEKTQKELINKVEKLETKLQFFSKGINKPDDVSTSNMDSICRKDVRMWQLLDWYSKEDVVVDEGEYCSSDPMYKVANIPIGPNVSAVIVRSVLVENSSLWRPTKTVGSLTQAVGVKIAWPANKIKMVDYQTAESSVHDMIIIYDCNADEDEIVAEGHIWSTDPKEVINDIPIGANAAVVKVEKVVKKDAYLWRPTTEIYLMEHVLQDYIAWPMNKINTQPSSQASPKASSPKSTSYSIANSSSNGKKICKLLDCENSGEIVAEGILMSSNPEDTVHCNPLGPNASKVWVKIKKIGTAKVWRPSPEVECIADALGTTVAWPSDKIVF